MEKHKEVKKMTKLIQSWKTLISFAYISEHSTIYK